MTALSTPASPSQPETASLAASPMTAPSLGLDRWRGLRLLLLCALVLAGAGLLAVVIGAVAIPPRAVLAMLVERLFGVATVDVPDTYRIILFDIRLPRVIFVAVTGAGLASAGAAYQGLFRNPLADPYLVGVASGAGLGATLALVFNLPASFLGLSAVPILAFVGALGTVALVILSAQVGRRMPVSTMLLSGVAIGAFASAFTTFIMLRSPDGLQRAFNWMLGGYGGGGWQPVIIILPYVAAGFVVLQFHARALNILQLDEDQARQLGIHVVFPIVGTMLVGVGVLVVTSVREPPPIEDDVTLAPAPEPSR